MGGQGGQEPGIPGEDTAPPGEEVAESSAGAGGQNNQNLSYNQNFPPMGAGGFNNQWGGPRPPAPGYPQFQGFNPVPTQVKKKKKKNQGAVGVPGAPAAPPAPGPSLTAPPGAPSPLLRGLLDISSALQARSSTGWLILLWPVLGSWRLASRFVTFLIQSDLH